jgi:hypothetical protein
VLLVDAEIAPLEDLAEAHKLLNNTEKGLRRNETTSPILARTRGPWSEKQNLSNLI